MTFIPERCDEFLGLFEVVRPHIAQFPGCKGVELLRDINDVNIMMTYSHWESAEDLEAYRKSELFSSTWAKTKVLFLEKAQAWSVEKIQS